MSSNSEYKETVPDHVYITYSGKHFSIKNIHPDNICLEDIAHHLAKICRYGGCMELGQHYSVAQHSIVLAYYAHCVERNTELAKVLLFHDATEAYLGDVVSGVKACLPDYKKLEIRLNSIINEKYGIDISNEEINSKAKEFDTRILLDEAALFVPKHYTVFKNQLQNYEPLGVTVISENMKTSEVMKQSFLDLCAKYSIKDQEKIK